MKKLWIMIFLLMPVFAGGCKLCYSWQLGRDRPPDQAPGMCAPPCAAPCVEAARVIPVALAELDKRVPSDVLFELDGRFSPGPPQPSNLSHGRPFSPT